MQVIDVRKGKSRDPDTLIDYQVITRRRILVSDLLLYKEKIDKACLKTVEELAEQAQELDRGY